MIVAARDHSRSTLYAANQRGTHPRGRLRIGGMYGTMSHEITGGTMNALTDIDALTRLKGSFLPFGRTAPRTQEWRLTDEYALAALVPISRVDIADAPILLSGATGARFLEVIAAGRAPLAEPPLDLDAFTS